MPRVRYTPDQIINKLQLAEILVSQEQSVKEAAKFIAVIETEDRRSVETRTHREVAGFGRKEIARELSGYYTQRSFL